MNSVPEVSIIIPTLNRAHYIGDAIKSILAQTYYSWELLIVDNGSTDNTEAIVKDYAKVDPRVRYLREDRKGVSRARNTALAEAKGVFIAFLDDDDLFLPEKLKIQTDYLKAHPEVDFVYGQIEIVNAQGDLLWVDPKKPVLTFADLFEESGIRIQSVMCRKSCFDSIGGFDETLTMGEDYDLWLRIAAKHRFEYLAVPFVKMRFHDTNTCNVPVPLYAQRDRLLKRVPTNPALGITASVKRRRLAINCYRLARLYKEDRQYFPAARGFLSSVIQYPVIGLIAAEKLPVFKNLFSFSLVKPLFAAGFCFFKGCLSVDRKHRKVSLREDKE